MPWKVVARNLEVTIKKTDAYRGAARFTSGTVAIQQFEPMGRHGRRLQDRRAVVKLTRLQLLTTDRRSKATGVVDLSKWPEQT